MGDLASTQLLKRLWFVARMKRWPRITCLKIQILVVVEWEDLHHCNLNSHNKHSRVQLLLIMRRQMKRIRIRRRRMSSQNKKIRMRMLPCLMTQIRRNRMIRIRVEEEEMMHRQQRRNDRLKKCDESECGNIYTK